MWPDCAGSQSSPSSPFTRSRVVSVGIRGRRCVLRHIRLPDIRNHPGGHRRQPLYVPVVLFASDSKNLPVARCRARRMLSLGWLYLLPDEFLSLGKQTAGSAAFLGNFIAWRQTGYFDQSGDLTLLVHLWSLGVEEQFYLIWPMLLAGFVARRWISALTGLIALSLALNVIF